MTLLSAVVLLILVMDPVGNVPMFLTSLRSVDPRRHTVVVLRELLIALAVMVFFLFLGKPLLGVLHISEPALTLAGGLILFLIALRMVFPSPHSSLQESIDGEPFIVPLAIPYVAGPSVLATEMLFMSRESHRWPEWLLAVFLAWLASAGILLAGSKLRGFFGEKGLIAMERLMGMLLVAIAVQMFLSGIEAFIKTQQ
jgi:MarC family membrane protein